MSMSADSVPEWPGAGGFVNISQNAQRLIFVGVLRGAESSRVPDGRLVFADGAGSPKFLDEVEQRTFSGQYAAARR